MTICVYLYFMLDMTLVDGLFGVSETAIAISRAVEYYQYEEKSSTKTVDRIGGSQERVTTYTDEKKWMSAPVNSAKFKDPAYQSSNFTLTTVEAKTERAKHVTFGGYALPSFIISSISGSIPATANLTASELAQWEKTLTGNEIQGVAVQRVHASGNTVYFGKSPSTPEIGDVRVTLTKIMPADISIIAKVVGSTFEPYVASNGKTVSKDSGCGVAVLSSFDWSCHVGGGYCRNMVFEEVSTAKISVTAASAITSEAAEPTIAVSAAAVSATATETA